MESGPTPGGDVALTVGQVETHVLPSPECWLLGCLGLMDAVHLGAQCPEDSTVWTLLESAYLASGARPHSLDAFHSHHSVSRGPCSCSPEGLVVSAGTCTSCHLVSCVGEMQTKDFSTSSRAVNKHVLQRHSLHYMMVHFLSTSHGCEVWKRGSPLIPETWHLPSKTACPHRPRSWSPSPPAS